MRRAVAIQLVSCTSCKDCVVSKQLMNDTFKTVCCCYYRLTLAAHVACAENGTKFSIFLKKVCFFIKVVFSVLKECILHFAAG